MNNKKIIITGGSGLIGKVLTNYLTLNGYNVCVISRKKSSAEQFIYWNPDTGEIEIEKIRNTYAVIHLAGCGIADKKWTEKYKKEIIESRVNTANFLFESFKKTNEFPSIFITASGIGYYGADTGAEIITENSPNGTDFIAKVCNLWENAADNFTIESTRVVKIRTGVVISSKGGFIEKITQSFKFYIGGYFGTGNQYISWIHINDLIKLYCYVLENNLIGAYNAVADNPITLKKCLQITSNLFNKKIVLLKIPKIISKLLFGDLSQILEGGNFVSNAKIKNSGFEFEYTTLDKIKLQ